MSENQIVHDLLRKIFDDVFVSVRKIEADSDNPNLGSQLGRDDGLRMTEDVARFMEIATPFQIKMLAICAHGLGEMFTAVFDKLMTNAVLHAKRN